MIDESVDRAEAIERRRKLSITLRAARHPALESFKIKEWPDFRIGVGHLQQQIAKLCNLLGGRIAESSEIAMIENGRLRKHSRCPRGDRALANERRVVAVEYARRVGFPPQQRSNRVGYTAPDGSTNSYTYDTLNRLITLANSWAGSFGFSYDSLSRRTQMTRPNGIATNYSYDSLSRLLSVLHQAGGSTIDGDASTLDAAGNRTAKTDYLAGVTSN